MITAMGYPHTHRSPAPAAPGRLPGNNGGFFRLRSYAAICAPPQRSCNATTRFHPRDLEPAQPRLRMPPPVGDRRRCRYHRQLLPVATSSRDYAGEIRLDALRWRLWNRAVGSRLRIVAVLRGCKAKARRYLAMFGVSRP